MTVSENPAEVIREGEGGGRIIDGKIAAAQVLLEVTARAKTLLEKGVKPGLAVVLVGENPASQVYVKAKGKAAKEAGFHSVQHDLPATTSEADILALVDALNNDPAIHGILVQLPLPEHVNSTKILESIDPEKDADGFHPVNVGLLAIGSMERALVPCTPAGSLVLVEKAAAALGVKLDGMNAVIVGRSNIVGKPMVAAFTLEEHDGDGGAFPHQGPRGRGAGRRPGGGGRRAAGDGEGRLDQARRHRH